MKLVNMHSILQPTISENYAHPAFNITAFHQLKGVLQVHENLRTPAIVQIGMMAISFLGEAGDISDSSLDEKARGADRLFGYVQELKETFRIPLVIHADHCKDVETIRMLIKKGFTSVMIDGSHLPFSENIELTREVVKIARPMGVTVEAELGILAGTEDNIFSETSTYTNPMLVPEFIRKTEANCLALSFGTKHGVRKGTSIKLRKEIVSAARENLLHSGYSTALVSHGSSTVPEYIVKEINNLGGKLTGVGGIPVPALQEVIACGIGKINIDTDMRLSITRNIRELLSKSDSVYSDTEAIKIRRNLEENAGEIDFRNFLAPVRSLLLTGEINSTFDQKIAECLEKGAAEMASQLLVQFNTVARAGILSTA